MAKLDGIIAYSHQGADEYLTNGFHPDRVFIAPNAAARRPEIRPTLRPEKVSGKLTVLFVGRLQQRKRIDNLLRACSELPFELQPRLCIVGDGPARQDLETLAAGCYPQTEFPGARFGTDLEQFFSEADLFVLPGTGGLAVQQAMAYGLPVIVAQGDGTQGDLVRPANGWVIPTDDLQALTAALQSALSDLPRLRRMGTESFRIVAEEVNLEHMAESFIHALNQIMSLSQPDAVSCISDQQDA